MALLPLPLTLAVAVSAIAISCERADGPEPKVIAKDETVEDNTPPPPAGVHPDDFLCESVATEAQIAEVIGGPVTLSSSPFEPPHGVARACNYRGRSGAANQRGQASRVDAGAAVAQATWSFDLDCRPSALRDGGQLMAQYAKSEQSRPLRIGKSAIDHRDVVLLFIDDDTPCYGRVLGPGTQARAAIAAVVAAGLTRKTAPALRPSF